MRAHFYRWRRLVLAAAGAGLIGATARPVVQGAVVDLVAAGPISSAVVVASGGDDKGCYEHLALPGTAQVQIGRDVGANWCRNEIAVQAQDYGMVLDTQPTWVAGATKVQLPSRVKLNLNLRVPSGIAWVFAAAQTQVDLADALLNHNRAGIALSMAGGAPKTYTTSDLNGPSDAAIIGTSCAAADGLIASDPARGLYNPASINVYYVEAITSGGSWGPEGFDCFEWGASNVIYISYDALDNILAHELGHALGLQYGNGHVNTLTDFKPTNLMYTWLPPDAAALQDHWTTGQVYRMNADTRSVLNQLVGVGPPARSFRKGVEEVCQEKPETTLPCLPLAFEGP
jgi:hypothetical protein